MKKLVKGFLETEAVREAVERTPVKPDKNGGDGRDISENFPVFHMNTMREREQKYGGVLPLFW